MNEKLKEKIKESLSSVLPITLIVLALSVTLVPMDENDRPTKVPGLILETEAERAEWEAGEKRRQMRKQREREGF